MRLSSRHLLFLSLALSLAVAAFAQSGGPRAMPIEPIKDFDIVPKGDVIQHEFVIKNEGDAPLEITDVNNAYIEAGEMTSDVLSGWWTDAGTFESLRRASNLVAEGGANRMDL